MKTILFTLTAVAAVALIGCSAVTPKLDEATGTSKAQRCVDYRGFLATALTLQETSPSEARAERIAMYRAFIAANCPPA